MEEKTLKEIELVKAKIKKIKKEINLELDSNLNSDRLRSKLIVIDKYNEKYMKKNVNIDNISLKLLLVNLEGYSSDLSELYKYAIML